MLREMAANRGCKLVKSRLRTPGKGDYGRYGLKDAKSEREILGFGKSGLTATPEEIEAHLRGAVASGWKSSVAAAGGKARPRKQVPAPAPPPPAPPPLRVREADGVDAEAIAALVAALGFEAAPDAVAERLTRLARAGEPPLVARRGDAILGCLTWHVTPVLHRPHPVGRITMLVVAASARREGVGRALVEAAEARLRARGCGLVEVTSNDKLAAAHKFYARLGYERTSRRFAKKLAS
jgi:ribosomal protein S18 acetylase RimI-like enzyme